MGDCRCLIGHRSRLAFSTHLCRHILNYFTAPRVLIKFFTAVYMPLDKDIIREAWVKGDLKDRLGIKHRRQAKNKDSKLEHAAIFHDPHARSESEVSLGNQEYYPAPTHSPAEGFTPPPQDTLFDSPPLSRAGRDIEAQYIVTKPSFDVGDDDPTPIATSSSNPLASGSGPPSPSPSYYSVNDIPLPSPQPEPVYRLTSGEYTTSPPPPRALSIAGTIRGAASSSTSPPPSRQSQSHDQKMRSSSGGHIISSSSGSYEMRSLSPQRNPNDHSHSLSPPPDRSQPSRGASESSFATAQEEQEEWWADGGEDADEANAPVHPQSRHRMPASDDDHSTIRLGDNEHDHDPEHSHHRPLSGQSDNSWDGGRAL